MEVYALFWNLQRFFDPAGLPVARALNSARDVWTDKQYHRKLKTIVTSLKAATHGETPAVLAFAEVESLRVMKDIRDATAWDDMAIIDELIPDHTLDGLNVGLMFN